MLTVSQELTGVVVGQYGTAVPISIVDADGNAVDISAYTTILVKTHSPDAQQTLSFTAAKVGSGTGGGITFTPSSSNTWNRDGDWEGQVQFSDTGILDLTPIFRVRVDKQI